MRIASYMYIAARCKQESVKIVSIVYYISREESTLKTARGVLSLPSSEPLQNTFALPMSGFSDSQPVSLSEPTYQFSFNSFNNSPYHCTSSPISISPIALAVSVGLCPVSFSPITPFTPSGLLFSSGSPVIPQSPSTVSPFYLAHPHHPISTAVFPNTPLPPTSQSDSCFSFSLLSPITPHPPTTPSGSSLSFPLHSPINPHPPTPSGSSLLSPITPHPPTTPSGSSLSFPLHSPITPHPPTTPSGSSLSFPLPPTSPSSSSLSFPPDSPITSSRAIRSVSLFPPVPPHSLLPHTLPLSTVPLYSPTAELIPTHSSHPVHSIHELYDHVVKHTELPKGWYDTTVHGDKTITLCALMRNHSHNGSIHSSRTLVINSDFSWEVYVGGRQVTCAEGSLLDSLPSLIHNKESFLTVLESVASYKVCIGNPDDRFQPLAQERNGRFMNIARTTTVATVDEQPVEIRDEEGTRIVCGTIRHRECGLLTLGSRCSACEKFRGQLRALLSKGRGGLASRTDPRSHVNLRFLNDKELKERHTRACAALKSRMARLKKKIVESTKKSGVTLSDETHADLLAIMEENSDHVRSEADEGSFTKLLWEEQLKYARKKNPRQMRWHPAMIRWCLYLRHLSSSAYEFLKSSGVVRLPSQRTLRDYTYVFRPEVGFQPEVDDMLVEEAKLEELEDWQKFCVLLVDEMHVKDELVYNKYTGELIGFVNLGDINNHLRHLEDASVESSIAKSVLVFMVRGMFIRLEFPYAQFSTRTLTGDFMYPLVWEAIKRLELCGVKVLAVTCDGASPNRKFFRLHKSTSPENHADGVTYRIPNPYSEDSRFVYFISDVPHLVKTTRNCWSNRPLWNNGKDILWRHLTRLYYQDRGENRAAPGLYINPKLKLEHIKLTNFSKMRVDLAAQVLSETVAKSLVQFGGEEAQGTAQFVTMFDRFFDCLNVTNFSESYKHLKVYRMPYRHGADFRVKWLRDEFLPYLRTWEQSVKAREGYTAAEKAMMCLSRETLEGLKMTVHSFTGMLEYIFKQPGVKCFFSERLCQDPLERFFSKQRQRGGTSNNPNVRQFIQNTAALRVVNTTARDVKRGNCKARNDCPGIENTPLPKRKRTKTL